MPNEAFLKGPPPKVHGVPHASYQQPRPISPPINTSGCVRATAILNQRFGPTFTRRFTQPNGAPYPLRPSAHRRIRQAEKQQVKPEPKETVRREVHNKPQEESMKQAGSKTVELAEFQKAFCDDTPVRDVLASGWYRNQITGKGEEEKPAHLLQQFGQEALEKAQKMIARPRCRSQSIKKEPVLEKNDMIMSHFKEKPQTSTSSLNPSKEQFSKETVEKAQELQQHAQQVVQRRQGLVPNTLLSGYSKKQNGPRPVIMMNKSTPNILRKNRSTDSPINQVPSTSISEMVVKEEKDVPLLETPRKRARKQVLEADNYCTGAGNISKEEEKKMQMEKIQELNALSLRSSSSYTAPPFFKKPPRPVQPPQPKKPRGRPRKVHSLLPVPAPKVPPKKRASIEKTTPPIRPPENTSKETSDAEKERLALIQTLPSSLIDAIKAQKVLEEEQMKNPKKVGRKPKKKLEVGDSVTESLKFLESITKLDPGIFGLNGLLDEEESNPPQATAVPTSVQPLDLELKMPRLIWTDDTGPLVPSSMYQKNEPVDEEEIVEEMGEVVYVDEATSSKLKIPPTIVEWRYRDDPPRVKKGIPLRKKKNLKRKLALKTNSFPILRLAKGTQRINRPSYFFSLFNKKPTKFLGIAYQQEFRIPKESEVISAAINNKFEDLVTKCSTVRFEEKLDHVVGHFADGKTLRYDIDENSNDFGPRWLAWHEDVVSRGRFEARKGMLAVRHLEIKKFMKKAESILGKFRGDVKAIKKLQVFYKKLKYSRARAARKLQRLEKMRLPAISLSESFRIKREALQVRLDRINWRKEGFRLDNLELRINEWEQSAIDYNASNLPVDKTFRRKKMTTSFQKLKRALYTYDSLVDTSMFASRLRLLYYHAEQIYDTSMDIVEIRDIVQACEDTEYYLTLCEIKLELIDQTDNNDRVKLINVYLSADTMNVAKGRLRRLKDTSKREKCEEILSKKIKRLVMRARNAGLIDVADCISTIPEKDWVGIIEHEQNARKNNEVECRVNIFDETNDFSAEIAAKLLAVCTLRRTLNEMWIKLPQLTSIADEKLKMAAEAEKNEPKHILRTMVPKFRHGYEDNQKEEKITIKKSDSLLNDLKLKFASGKAFFNPATMNESRLPPETFNKFQEFRRLKRKELAIQNNAKTFVNSDNPEEILKRIRLVSYQPKTEESQQLLERYKMLYQKVQKKKTLERRNSGETRAEKSSVVVKKDWDYVNMLDELEFFNGISDDEFDDTEEEESIPSTSS